MVKKYNTSTKLTIEPPENVKDEFLLFNFLRGQKNTQTQSKNSSKRCKNTVPRHVNILAIFNAGKVFEVNMNCCDVIIVNFAVSSSNKINLLFLLNYH